MVVAVGFDSGGPALEGEVDLIPVLCLDFLQNAAAFLHLLQKPELGLLQPDEFGVEQIRDDLHGFDEVLAVRTSGTDRHFLLPFQPIFSHCDVQQGIFVAEHVQLEIVILFEGVEGFEAHGCQCLLVVGFYVNLFAAKYTGFAIVVFF